MKVENIPAAIPVSGNMARASLVYGAAVLWGGCFTGSAGARPTTAGTFIRPPAHAEEMYNPAVSGRSDGGTFEVRSKGP